MNSLAWTVIAGEKRYVAKPVPRAERSAFEAALAAAAHLLGAKLRLRLPDPEHR